MVCLACNKAKPEYGAKPGTSTGYYVYVSGVCALLRDGRCRVFADPESAIEAAEADALTVYTVVPVTV